MDLKKILFGGNDGKNPDRNRRPPARRANPPNAANNQRGSAQATPIIPVEGFANTTPLVPVEGFANTTPLVPVEGFAYSTPPMPVEDPVYVTPPIPVQSFANTTPLDTPQTYVKPITAGDKTLQAILSGLKLHDDNDDNTTVVSNRYKTTDTPYDIIIRINSLSDLSSKGWEIILGERTKNLLLKSQVYEVQKEEQRENDISKNLTYELDDHTVGDADLPKSVLDSMGGVIVTILGSYNRGKSFLLNQLCHISTPSGTLIRTEGISITAGRERYSKIAFLDTAGTDTPVKIDAIEYKKATEAMLRELILSLCSFIIIVVNRLRATDQLYIQQILKYCKSTNKKGGIIIVHNLLDLSTLVDVQSTIEDELKSIYGATEDAMQISVDGYHRTIEFFKSIQEGIEVRHFVLAKAGSEAANKWNTQSLDGIMNICQTSSEYKRHLDIISDMIAFINERLPQLLIHKDNSKDSNPQQNLQVVQHNNQPFIVLSDRKDFEDLCQDPYKLELAKPIIYDDSGFFIRHESGQWQPRYNLYGTADNIHIIFELPGVKEGECKIKVLENVVFLEGTRGDLKTSSTDVLLHQSEIQSGSFKLEIPLPYAVDINIEEVKRDNGLIRVTLLRKKQSEKSVSI